MLYSKVVVGLPPEGPFDYLVPPDLKEKIKVGARVRVSFGFRKVTGYVVALSPKTKVGKVKKILELIDEESLLPERLLFLAKRLSAYYSCSWGEAIETAIPQALRKGRRAAISSPDRNSLAKKEGFFLESILLHALDLDSKWFTYIEEIKKAVKNKKSAIVVLPDIDSALAAQAIISSNIELPAGIFYRNCPQELDEWLKARNGGFRVIAGTRSNVFAPVKDLGLIIVDEEESFVYKQDQVPHYHARDLALMRARQEDAKVILGSSAPSLESFYLCKKNELKYSFIPRKTEWPEIKTVDMKAFYYSRRKKESFFSKYLQDAIASALDSKQKVLLFLNRKGFAGYCFCHNCAKVLKCPHCNISLTYYSRHNTLKCRYCAFKIPSPEICPDCNAGYIKFGGTGIEKLESELSRLFAQNKVKSLGEAGPVDFKEADIFIATSSVLKERRSIFGLVGVLGVDSALNQVDFRAGERVFELLSGLAGLARDKVIIETSLAGHHCFQALIKHDPRIFYEQELKERRQLGFAPFRHMALVKIRGKKEERVEQIAQMLFERFKQALKDKGIKLLSVNPSERLKLRGNFYWQILFTTNSPDKLSEFLKANLRAFSHSGAVLTVDIDTI